MEKIFKINDQLSIPMNFGIGAFEAFMEANQVTDITKIQELFTGPQYLKNIRAFMLCCAQYYCELRDQECTLTIKDLTRSIDLTGGFQSTFIKEFVEFFMKALGLEEADTPAEEGEQLKN